MKPRVFAINYTLKGADGAILDASEAGQPLPFLEGTGQIIPALEDEIKKLSQGEKKTVNLKAKDAYGLQEDKMKMDVPKTDLSHIQDLQVGTFLQLDLGEQTKVVRVTKMDDSTVTLDGNHPLAGQDLTFEIEIVQVRDATQEELAHGHAHGLHGHGHHH